MCFHKGRNKEWQDVEDFARAESCGKDENLPASPYKVAVSSDKFISITVADTSFLNVIYPFAFNYCLRKIGVH